MSKVVGKEPAPRHQDVAGPALTICTAETAGQAQRPPVHDLAGDPACAPEGGQEGGLPPTARAFLNNLLCLKLLTPHSVAQFLVEHADRLPTCAGPESLGAVLMQEDLLTEYQLDRVMSGTSHGLVLGNHKVLRKIGAGGMGVVFLAEHLFLHRREAVKVLPVDDDCPPDLLSRFYSEMQVLAELRHPNIVTAYDAGQEPAPKAGMPALLYLAMELVGGGDLEKYVLEQGPAPIGQACHWICQAAAALQEAHDHNLIHRDVKPSNMLLTTHGDVKIVDFGLVQQFCTRLTKRGLLLGSIDYMPPEQSRDASAVGTAADIYGLGASLFWLLTGEPPYPRMHRLSQSLEALRNNAPRSVRALRPEVSPELETVLASLLHRDPICRPALPLTVSRALSPFANPTPRAGS